MATDDPNYSYLLRRIEELEQLLRANPLRSASVSRGTTEFRDDSTLLITDSNMRVVGRRIRLRAPGRRRHLLLSGPTLLDGSVETRTRSTCSPRPRLRGETTIEGLTRLLAELVVEGKITAGGVRIEDDRIYIGDQMVLDPATDGGAATSATARSCTRTSPPSACEKGTARSPSATPSPRCSSVARRLRHEDGIALTGLREVKTADGLKWLGITNTGEVVKVDPAVGGPMEISPGRCRHDGDRRVRSARGPRRRASTFHEGHRLRRGQRHTHPRRGARPRRVRGFDTDGGYGNYVLINHGNGVKTRSAHMNAAPPSRPDPG